MGNALALFLGSLVIQMAYAGLGAALQKWLSDARAISTFNATSGVLVAAFGLYGLARVVVAR
jgi:threonine/homoserine/homoserine lactone efflux protein